MGYITRHQGNHREARVYKGWNPNTEAIATLRWHLTDTTTEGILPVYWRKYNREEKTFDPPRLSDSGWITNIALGHEHNAVMTDMFSFSDPSWSQPFDPYTKSDCE